MKISITVITETKKKGKGIEQIGEFIHIFSGVPKHKRAAKGVSILINHKYKNKLTNWEAVTERIVTANLNIQGHKTTIVGVYAPTEDTPDNEKDQFYEQLDETLTRIGNQREIIMMGDMNARTGKKTNDKVVGSNGEGIVNDNGQRTIGICEQHNLKILNGFYAHKDIHKYTWHQDTRQLKSIIDYIIIKQNSKWKVLDTRVYRGIECGSDHYLLISQIEIPFKQEKKNDEETHEHIIKETKFNLNGLYDASTRQLYKSRLDQKLDPISLEANTDTLYTRIIEAIKNAATEALGIEEPKKRCKGSAIEWNSELEYQKQQKQEAYHKWLSTGEPTDKTKYREEQSKFKKMVINNKNKKWEQRCAEVESYLGGSKQSEAWRFIRNLKNENINRTNIQLIEMNKWKEHYEKELREDRQEYMNHSPKVYQVHGPHVTITDKVMKTAIDSLKNKRASGPEGVPAELLKNGTVKLYTMLKELCNRYLNGENIPDSWREAWITPIHKKGCKKDCNNYRCISVTSTFSRLYGKIIKILIEDEYMPFELEQQAGFRAGRSCIDHIFTITQINEKKVATNRQVHLLFVDLTKAYDTVPLYKLWQTLEKTTINATLIKAIQHFYNDLRSKVKIHSDVSDNFMVTKGLRQGCSLSPTLFKIYLNEALKHWRRACSGMGIPITDNSTLFTLHFADDQVVIAQDREDLEFMTNRLISEYKKWGLIVNMQKTKYMCVGGGGEELELNDGTRISVCTEYNYLGTTITQDGHTEKEIHERIKKGRKIIGALNSLLWSKTISKEKKKRLYNSIVECVVLYGCETWQLNERIQRKLSALEMDFWRRSAQISRLQHINNERVRELMNVETTIIEKIQQRQLCWYGHVQRMGNERIPKQIINWTPMERRKRGRPKATWFGGIQKAMSERDLRPGDWDNRHDWRLGTGRRRTL